MSVSLRGGAPPSSSGRRREARTGFLLVLPSTLVFLIFVLGPLLAVAVLSLTKYDVLSAPTFVGPQNYLTLLADPRLATAYRNTIVYVVADVLIMNTVSLVLAVLLNRHMPPALRIILRSAYFFPSLVALVYVSVIWQGLLQDQVGVVNYYITSLGGPQVPWLSSQEMAIPTVVLVNEWRNLGFGLLIFLAALQDVPKELTESAEIDGAGFWTTVRRIQIPLISPAIFLNITLIVIGSFQLFESIIVLTAGGPGDASRSVVMYLTEQAFSGFRMGYASAISVTLFLIILVATAIQFRLRRNWVHYE